jgi:hypothetical protein
VEVDDKNKLASLLHREQNTNVKRFIVTPLTQFPKGLIIDPNLNVLKHFSLSLALGQNKLEG